MPSPMRKTIVGVGVRRTPLFGALLLLLLLAGGCDHSIKSEYGKITGKSRGKSVNGTSVLRRMFEDAGARVRPASRLGRVFDRSDVVIWIPNRFQPPEEETRTRIEEWLREKDNRTLVYVGRDFDATPLYWDSVLESTPPNQQMEVRRRAAVAKVEHAIARAGNSGEEDCEWFALDRTRSPRVVRSLTGPWSRGVDAELADLRLHTRIEPSEITRADPEDADWKGAAKMESLLSSGDDLIVGRYTRESWQNSQIIVIANGSWLLNAPLVNHEHRKLVGRLIRECGQSDRVAFLMSGPGSPTESNGGPNQHHGLAAFTVWPVNCILIHLFVLGIVYLFSVFPIFGRPWELEEGRTSDFGKHIRALGSLLSLTDDREFARQRREYYQQRVAHEPATLEPVAAAQAPAEARQEPTAAGSGPDTAGTISTASDLAPTESNPEDQSTMGSNEK